MHPSFLSTPAFAHFPRITEASVSQGAPKECFFRVQCASMASFQEKLARLLGQVALRWGLDVPAAARGIRSQVPDKSRTTESKPCHRLPGRTRKPRSALRSTKLPVESAMLRGSCMELLQVCKCCATLPMAIPDTVTCSVFRTNSKLISPDRAASLALPKAPSI